VAEATGADPGRLYLCASTSEAYSWLFKLLCEPGEAVLVPRPGYPLFDQLAALEGVRALGYPQEYNHPGGWSVDLGAIESLIHSPDGGRVKVLVLINPNNPTGAYVQAAEREAILGLCERHGLALIVDEVFFGFPLEPRRGRASFLGEARVACFVLDGLSKRLCLPQAKLGWISVSGPASDVTEALARLDILADAYLSAGSPVMNALPRLFSFEGAMRERVLGRMRETMATYRKVLEYSGSPHRLLRCEGGWTAIVESPRLAGEEELALELLGQENVLAHPGYFFDMEREPHFAFSLILDPATAREGAGRYRELFDRLTLS
jgi:aspartate/methionine/tyrosine aminotransferase